MELTEQKTISATENQHQNQFPNPNPQKSKHLPILSAEEHRKILDFIKSKNNNFNDEQAETVLQFRYPNCNNLSEVEERFESLQADERAYIKAEQRRKFEESKNRLQDLIKSARVPKIFSDIRTSDFKISKRNEESAKIAIQAITNNAGLYIYGECGTGKTMLASIIANERAERNKSSMFIGAVDIFQELNPYSTDSRTASTRKQIVKNIPCLIVDDLGAEKPSDWTKQTLFEILDYRYRENLQTVITSNFSVDALKSEGRLKEYEGNRIIRRIKAICNLVELNHY